MSRRTEANSKSERAKLAKELRMARIFAKAGHRVLFTQKGAGNHDVFFDGVATEFKQVVYQITHPKLLSFRA